MFINAEPRHVSNGCFETFVHRPTLHRRLVDMTNNDINAWGGFGPVVRQETDTWDEHLNDMSNEKFLIQSPFGGYFQHIESQPQRIDPPYRSSYSISQQPQYSSNRRVSPPVYQPATNMNCFDKASPMLSNEYSTWNSGHGHDRGSFAEFSGMHNVLKGFTYQPSTESAMSPFSAMAPSNLLHTSYLNGSSGIQSDVSEDMTSPSTVYSGFSTSKNSPDPRSMSQYEISGAASSMESWWPDHAIINRSHNHAMLLGHDGQPRYETSSQPQQFNSSWITDLNTANVWSGHDLVSTTISPKELSLNISTPLSMSGSSQGSVLQISDSSASESADDDQSNYSSTESSDDMEQQRRRPLQILPDSGPVARRILPNLPSNDNSPTETIKNRSARAVATSRGNSSRKFSSPLNRASPDYSSYLGSSSHKRIKPKPISPSERGSHPPSSAKVNHGRDAKDDFLVQSKLAGMSYKDIRKKGKFTEAESTLRGRFRTLTKHKTARVRKPEWNDNDVRLLKKAVRKLTKNSDPSKSRVPWKQVAEYISENGGSYHFGNATCRKRWDELQLEL